MSNDAQTPCDPNDPILIAFTAWKQTDRFPVCRQWAQNPAHVDGSLWEAFTAGYGRAPIETKIMQPTLTEGMDNVIAMRLGQIAADAGQPTREDVGDAIDRGLILRRLLAEAGFSLIRNSTVPLSGTPKAKPRNTQEGETLPPMIEQALTDALDLPAWFPACPWPTTIWPATLEAAGSALRERFGKTETTAISGTLMRHGWQVAALGIAKALEERYRGETDALVHKLATALSKVQWQAELGH